MYVLRVRQPDGSWEFDDETMTKKEAEYAAKLNRILLGTLCQVWTEREAANVRAAAAGLEGDGRNGNG